MAENLTHRLLPHQGCVIARTDDGIDVSSSAMNWVMSACVAPFTCRAPFTFRVLGRTDSTNLRMHWHRRELIFNWECSVLSICECTIARPEPPASDASNRALESVMASSLALLTACATSAVSPRP